MERAPEVVIATEADLLRDGLDEPIYFLRLIAEHEASR